MEQFEMEQLVYTQDGIYFKALNESQTSGQATEDNFAGYDNRIKYPEMLKAYYEVNSFIFIIKLILLIIKTDFL